MLFETKKFTEAEFAGVVSAYPEVEFPIEQSVLWENFEATLPNRVSLGVYGYYRAGVLVATASLVACVDRLRNWVWIRKGPVWVVAPTVVDEEIFLETVRWQFSKKNVGRINFSPIFVKVHLYNNLSVVRDSFELNLCDKTVVVDLRLDESQIFAQCNASARRKIRLAKKQGVEVVEIVENRAQFFRESCYPVMEETAVRSGFRIRGAIFYEKMLNSLPDNTYLYVAYFGQQVVSWAIVSQYNRQAVYYYGAGNAQARKIYAAYLLQHEVMLKQKVLGADFYDLLGIGSEKYPHLAKLDGFKTSFSKNVVTLSASYDFLFNKPKYLFVTNFVLLHRKIKNFLNNLHKKWR